MTELDFNHLQFTDYRTEFAVVVKEVLFYQDLENEGQVHSSVCKPFKALAVNTDAHYLVDAERSNQ